MDKSYLGAEGTIGKSSAYSVRGDIERRWWLKTTLASRRLRVLDTQETPREFVTEATKNTSRGRRHVNLSGGVVGRHVGTRQRGRVGTESGQAGGKVGCVVMWGRTAHSE